MSEKIDKILDIVTEIKIDQAEMRKDVSQNTDDLAEHIRRTNLLEGKLQKIIYLLMVGAGIGIALYGPEAFKLIGLFI